MTWHLKASEAGVDLALIQTSLLLFCKSSCSDANGLYLHEKTERFARSPPASLPFKGQVTEQTTLKWPIDDWFIFSYLLGVTEDLA